MISETFQLNILLSSLKLNYDIIHALKKLNLIERCPKMHNQFKEKLLLNIMPK